MKRLPHIRPLLLTLLLVVSVMQAAAARRVNSDSVFTALPATSYPVSAEGLPVFSHQIDCGADTDGAADYAVRLDYAEYAPLTAEEVGRIKRGQLAVADTIVPRVETGISRRHTLLDVTFTPIVRRGGRYLRLVSCKLVVEKSATLQSFTTSRLQSFTTSQLQSSTGRWADASVLSTGKWVKIRVSDEGVYSLTASQLAGWGFSDPSRVKLYGYGGRPQDEAWTFTAGNNNRVPDDLCEVPLYRRTNDLLFYAEGTVRWTWNTTYSQWVHETQPYSRYSYYFITEGDSPLSFSTADAVSSTSTSLSTITHHALLDRDEVGIYAGGRQLYDSHNFATDGTTKTYRLAAPGIVAGETAKACIAVGASNSSSSVSVQAAANGTSLGTLTVRKYGENESGAERRETFSTTALTADNTFTFACNTSAPTRLNYICLTYPCALNATSLTTAFTPNVSGAVTLTIEGASSSTQLWCIGTADDPAKQIPATLSGATLTANVSDGTRRYILVDAAATSYSSPTYVGTVENQNLHADTGIDMVIIVPSSGKLTEQATRLAEAHAAKDSLNVKVVTAEQLYNEFSSGTPDASAYRRYLKMLYDRASSEADAPRYLLLFGDCAWDNRMITSDWTGYSPNDFLLSFEVNDGYTSLGTRDFALGSLASYVTDDFFTWLDDSEGTSYSRNKPDVAVGRFLCHDAATAKTLVDKAIAYMNNDVVGAWKNRVYVLGDDGDNNLHMTGAETVASSITDACDDELLLHKVYWDAYTRTVTATGSTYPQVTAMMQEYMRQGALLFNYMGHGSPEQISHRKILLKDDFAVTSSSRLPLWVMASCEITPYDSQEDDIGRTALYNETGGAIGVVCASRAVYASSNTALNSEFVTRLLSNDGANTLGEALRLTKNALLNSGGNVDYSINKLKYVLLGDPALKLAMPRQRVVLDSINGAALTASTFLTLKAGSVARFSGHVCGTDGTALTTFNGTLTATLSDREETITCKNNDGSATTPLTYTDRTKTIYEGSDSVTAGRFTLQVAIPRDISYTNDAARLTLYAVSTDHAIEANGHNEQFCLNGTADSIDSDTIPPTVYVYLDTPDFQNGGITSTSPVFFAEVSDNAGLSVSGISIGHDMELVLDNNAANLTVLNDYFTYTFGDYRSGQVSYALSGLTAGAHTLSFKAWDVNNNATTATLSFYVSDNVPTAFDISVTQNPATTTTNFVTVLSSSATSQLTIDVYDLMGRKVWTSSATTSSTYNVQTWNLTDATGARLPAGLYFFKATTAGEAGEEETDAKKIIIVEQ